MAGDNIVLKWFVRDVQELNDPMTGVDTHFIIAPIGRGIERSVIKRATTWECTCGSTAPQGEFGCLHITRARLYYANMLERAAKMKQQLKTVVEQNKQARANEGVLPLNARRNIKLDDE